MYPEFYIILKMTLKTIHLENSLLTLHLRKIRRVAKQQNLPKLYSKNL